ncbi:type II toxin-antitoxin system RelB family antitoxin [Atopobiaceae bacterium SGI.236]
MAMEATTIRFEPEEKSWIQAYADFVGRTFSDVVREAALEAVEAAADRQAYQDALAADDGIRYSTDDVMRMALEAE